MKRRSVVAALAVLVLLGTMLLACSDSDVQTGTYVGWNATMEGEGTPRYMIELEDGTKILAASDEAAPKEGEEVKVRQLEDDTWVILSEE